MLRDPADGSWLVYHVGAGANVRRLHPATLADTTALSFRAAGQEEPGFGFNNAIDQMTADCSVAVPHTSQSPACAWLYRSLCGTSVPVWPGNNCYLESIRAMGASEQASQCDQHSAM